MKERFAMQVNDVMTARLDCIAPEATLQAAAERMRALDLGAMPVCDRERLWGMITDRDIVVRSVADGHDPVTDHVCDIMTLELVYCYDDQDLNEVAELMREKQVRRLPVLNRENRLVGIVSLGDLALDTGDEQLAGHVLVGISEPAPTLG
jgi:CBS domain-containing protein